MVAAGLVFDATHDMHALIRLTSPQSKFAVTSPAAVQSAARSRRSYAGRNGRHARLPQHPYEERAPFTRCHAVMYDRCADPKDNKNTTKHISGAKRENICRTSHCERGVSALHFPACVPTSTWCGGQWGPRPPRPPRTCPTPCPAPTEQAGGGAKAKAGRGPGRGR